MAVRLNLEVITKNDFYCNWETVYIGRKLKFISAEDVTKYAMKYLDTTEEIDDLNIIELAWNLPEDQIDYFLYEVVKIKLYGENANPLLKEIELKKWRYCALKEILLESNDEEELFNYIEDIFSIFDCPEDMYDFIRKASDMVYYEKKDYYTLKKLVLGFLENEKFIINKSVFF